MDRSGSVRLMDVSRLFCECSREAVRRNGFHDHLRLYDMLELFWFVAKVSVFTTLPRLFLFYELVEKLTDAENV